MNTMTTDEVLAVIDDNFVEARQFRKAKGTDSTEADAEASDCRLAVAALIERNADLEANASRLAFLLGAEAAVHKMGDTGLYMLVSIEGDPYDGSEHETPQAAIDAARAEARNG